MSSRRTLLHACLISLIALAICFGWHLPSYALGRELPAIAQPAPDFTLPTNTGNKNISLADFRGQWVVVYFYPKDFTSGCTLEARRFQQDLPQYIASNTQVLGISADSVDTHAEFCDSEGLKFPLLADTDGSVSKAYGSWLGALSLRHTFIIDPDGILRDRFVKVNPTGHSREVLAKLSELQNRLSTNNQLPANPFTDN
jgi:thioredoxin-dependent peroxiredoxin